MLWLGYVYVIVMSWLCHGYVIVVLIEFCFIPAITRLFVKTSVCLICYCVKSTGLSETQLIKPADHLLV